MFELGKLNCFMNHLPMQMPMKKTEIYLFHYLILILFIYYMYFWFSTYYEYIDSTNKPDNLTANIVNKKQKLENLQ